jgi:serine/threonine protein kinase
VPVSEADDTTDSLVAKVARIPERRAPLTIGRYQILRTLGSGGMGVVYEADDPELSRRVAIKVLHETSDGERATRLRREAQTLAKLMHANVVTVFDVGAHDGEVYIVMQLVDGVTLDRHVDGKPVDAIVSPSAFTTGTSGPPSASSTRAR